MHRKPVPGDVDAARDPDGIVVPDVIEEAGERRPGRPAIRQCSPIDSILGASSPAGSPSV